MTSTFSPQEPAEHVEHVNHHLVQVEKLHLHDLPPAKHQQLPR
jgi:hypothetical protein